MSEDRSKKDRRSSARRGALAVVAVAAVAFAGFVAGRLGSAPARSAPPRADQQPTPPTTGGSHRPAPPADITTVAEATVTDVRVFDRPAADAPVREIVKRPLDGAPLVFVVRRQLRSWLSVYLPIRPNGSTGWIRLHDTRLTQHDYRIVVELHAHRITVFRGERVVDREPVGVGTSTTPTPGGHYYTAELFQPPDPRGFYGPYAYGLSGFSNVLENFAGGPGIIGIHGTNDPAGLGHDVSHGCIRMSNAGITRLARVLPLGVPVDIRA